MSIPCRCPWLHPERIYGIGIDRNGVRGTVVLLDSVLMGRDSLEGHTCVVFAVGLTIAEGPPFGVN